MEARKSVSKQADNVLPNSLACLLASLRAIHAPTSPIPGAAPDHVPPPPLLSWCASMQGAAMTTSASQFHERDHLRFDRIPILELGWDNGYYTRMMTMMMMMMMMMMMPAP